MQLMLLSMPCDMYTGIPTNMFVLLNTSKCSPDPLLSPHSSPLHTPTHTYSHIYSLCCVKARWIPSSHSCSPPSPPPCTPSSPTPSQSTCLQGPPPPTPTLILSYPASPLSGTDHWPHKSLSWLRKLQLNCPS